MKGGLMIRDSLAANSKHFSIFMTGNGNGINPYCEFRTENGEDSTDNYSGQTFVSNRTNIRLKIVKTGNVLRAYYKRESDINFLAFPEQQINFSSDSFFVGIAVTSHHDDYISELRVAGDLVLSASEQGWNQNWEVIFAEQYDNVLSQAHDIGNVRKPGSHYKTSTGIAVRGSGPGTIRC
jgi:hypothetical protein